MLIDTNLISDYSIAQLREIKRIAREELEKRFRIEQVKAERSRHSAKPTADYVAQVKAVLETK
jgi:hypothetical protein